MKLGYIRSFSTDKDIYDDFARVCDSNGFIKSQILTKLMQKFVEEHS